MFELNVCRLLQSILVVILHCNLNLWYYQHVRCCISTCTFRVTRSPVFPGIVPYLTCLVPRPGHALPGTHFVPYFEKQPQNWFSMIKVMQNAWKLLIKMQKFVSFGGLRPLDPLDPAGSLNWPDPWPWWLPFPSPHTSCPGLSVHPHGAGDTRISIPSPFHPLTHRTSIITSWRRKAGRMHENASFWI